MLQVISNCYYLSVQEKLEILVTGMVIIWTLGNGVKNMNPIILLLINQSK